MIWVVYIPITDIPFPVVTALVAISINISVFQCFQDIITFIQCT